MFPIVTVDRTRAEIIEQLGTKSKFWYTRDGVRTLFKAEERGTGEDWAEKVACELAELLGLPHVYYDMALESESLTPGVVCAAFLGRGESLAHGNQLMLAIDENYPRDGRRYHVSAHTVRAVTGVLELLKPPDARWAGRLPAGVTHTIDIFAGYLMFDAWIANQDRHHQNWGAIFRPAQPIGSLTLAPSYDHGASMARNVSDAEKHERLTSKDRGRGVPAFAKRARSALFKSSDDAKPLTTLAAWSEVARLRPSASAWVERLRAVAAVQVEHILAEVPPQRMSAICRDFTLELLSENRRRILEGETE
jgi:hypothetical protein